MDQTSHTVAVVLPIAAAFGLAGLVILPSLAIRATKYAICPERARREAAERAAAQAGVERASAASEAGQLGGASRVGAQRRTEEIPAR